MRTSARRAALLALLLFLAALAGVFAGRAISESRSKSPSTLHEVLHDQLNLSPEQEAKVSRLETEFAARRRALEFEIRAENARLAEAIQAEHGYGPRVTAEVDRSHKVMGQLQKETLSHIFAMRAILTPEQAQKFDRAVVEALTADTR